MKNINISRTFPSSEAAYEISWHTVISAIKRRKHLGEKTVDDLSIEDFEQLRIEIAARCRDRIISQQNCVSHLWPVAGGLGYLVG